MRNDLERLQDILEAIARIEKYAERGKEIFEQDELIQTWIAYHLQVVGEAARAISVELKSQFSNVTWAQAVSLRSVLVHEYFRINTEIVWAIVQEDLPELKRKIEAVLQQLNQES